MRVQPSHRQPTVRSRAIERATQAGLLDTMELRFLESVPTAPLSLGPGAWGDPRKVPHLKVGEAFVLQTDDLNTAYSAYESSYRSSVLPLLDDSVDPGGDLPASVTRLEHPVKLQLRHQLFGAIYGPLDGKHWHHEVINQVYRRVVDEAASDYQAASRYFELAPLVKSGKAKEALKHPLSPPEPSREARFGRLIESLEKLEPAWETLQLIGDSPEREHEFYRLFEAVPEGSYLPPFFEAMVEGRKPEESLSEAGDRFLKFVEVCRVTGETEQTARRYREFMQHPEAQMEELMKRASESTDPNYVFYPAPPEKEIGWLLDGLSIGEVVLER